MPEDPGEISSGEAGVAEGESVRSIVTSNTLWYLGGVAEEVRLG